MANFSVKVQHVGTERFIFLRGTIVCNATSIKTSFSLDTVEREGDPHVGLMLSQYSTYRLKTDGCYSLIYSRHVDVTAMTKAFDEGVWVLTFLTCFITARIISWLKLDGFYSLLTRTLLSFISAAEIRAEIRRYSHLIVLASLLALTFFVGQIYTNTFMSFFLDPRTSMPCDLVMDCGFRMDCHSAAFLRMHLSFRRCLCNLNQKELNLVGKPLVRRNFTVETASSELGFPFYLYNRYLQKTVGQPLWEKGISSDGQVLLLLTRVSSVIDRLFQTGFLFGDQSLELTKAEVDRFGRKVVAKAYKVQEKLLMNMWHEAMDFDTPADRFDMERFSMTAPIFGACFLTIYSVLCLERLFSGLRKSRSSGIPT